jgi:RimJ/RimL family protein N-acetyltransferase
VALLRRAARAPAVRTVRATISPDNVASRDLVLQHGFVEVGEQWDDEDGLELVQEVAAARRDQEDGRRPCFTRPRCTPPT